MENERNVQEEIAQLLALFPQLKPEDVPAEVWEEVKGGKNLPLTYCFHRLKEVEAELRALRGKKLSTGSVGTAGDGEVGTLASYWDSYKI